MDEYLTQIVIFTSVSALCKAPGLMSQVVLECNAEYNWFSEDRRNFTFGWLGLEGNYSDPADEVEAAFRYRESV